MRARQKHLALQSRGEKTKTRWTQGKKKKEKPSAPESLQASSYKRWGFSNYLQAVLCDAYKYKQEGTYSYTRGNLQPFAIRGNEIQVHKEDPQL